MTEEDSFDVEQERGRVYVERPQNQEYRSSNFE